jgi:tetratricopeptide (TPR) repeat protein
LSLNLGPSRDRASAGAELSATDAAPGQSLSPGEQPDAGRLNASSEKAPQSRPRKAWLSSKFLLGSLLLVLTLAVYGQTCGFDFIILDDPSYVKLNRYVLDGLNLSGLKWAVTQFNDANWIPLTWLSLMLNASIHKNWPDGYHIMNVLLHAANVLLVFTIFAQMTGSTGRSAFVAAIFAVHPLHVESVAWVTERKDVLCTFFGLLSLWAYVSYAQTRRRWRYWTAFALLLVSLTAKQTFVTLPCVFLLLDYWPLDRFRPVDSTSGESPEPASGGWRWARLKPLIVEKIPFFILVGGFSALAVWAQMGGGIRSLESVPLSARVLNAISAYGWYAWKALVPRDLAIFYPHPVASLRPIDVLIPAAFLVTTTAVAIWQARRRPYLIVGWLWYLGTLFPLIGLIQIGRQRVADRYAYLPLLGLYFAVAWLIPSLVPGRGRLHRWLLSTAALAAIAVYGFLGFQQVALWGDDVKLFEHALAVTPDNAMSRSSLGCAFFARGDVKHAIANMEHSLRLDPHEAGVHDDLGSAYQADKRFDDAAREYRLSIEIKEDSASPHVGLGSILCERHQFAEARKEFLRALEIEPQAPMTYFNLSMLCEDLKEYDQAIEYAKQGLEIDPKNVECQRQIAHVLSVQGRLDEAIAAYEKVVAFSASDAEARIRINELMARKFQQQSSKTQTTGSLKR